MVSLKSLKFVAHNIGSQFAGTLTYWDDDYGINHLARSAQAVGGTVVIDLLSGTSSPALTREGGHALRVLSANVPVLLAKAGFPTDLLTHAEATYHFSGAEPERGGMVAYRCRIVLTTHDGRSHAVDLTERNS